MVPLQPAKINSDYNIWWRPGRIYIPANDFSGWIGAAGVDVGSGTGAPVQQEISTFGLVSVLMDTAGDELNHLMQIPYDFDPKKKMEVRVHWTSGSATTADTIDWLVRYQAIVPDSTTLASASTALDTQPAQDTVIGAYTHQVTTWGTILPATIGENVEMIQWEVEMDAFAAGLTEDKFFLGLEIAYSPRRMYYGEGMAHPAKRPVSMLGKVYS